MQGISTCFKHRKSFCIGCALETLSRHCANVIRALLIVLLLPWFCFCSAFYRWQKSWYFFLLLLDESLINVHSWQTRNNSTRTYNKKGNLCVDDKSSGVPHRLILMLSSGEIKERKWLRTSDINPYSVYFIFGYCQREADEKKAFLFF